MSRYIDADLIEECKEIADDSFEWGTYVVKMSSIRKLPTAEARPMQVELEADGYADGELVYDYGKCPKCGWEFEEDDKDWEEPYCCHCGQKLKWFENEEEGDTYED